MKLRIYNIRRLLMPVMIMLVIIQVWSVSPQEAVNTFIKTSGVGAGSVAVKITDLSDGHTIGRHNNERALIPASIMKSVTSAALLHTAGPDYRYHTTVYTDGPVKMGILNGNLIIEGACDPSLNSNVEPYGTDIIQEIIERLRKSGINRIEGSIIIDESAFAGPARPSSWQPADFSQSYGTGCHSFNFENNCSGHRSVENPKALFKSKLKNALAKEGIITDGKDLGDGNREILFTHFSPTLDEIMRSCMMRSDNLFAESMLRTYGKLSGGDGSTADAAEREQKMWRKNGMPLNGVTIIDGSGLSRNNRVTADFMTSVLSRMAGDEVYASLFPLAGQDGTLKSFLADTPLEGYIAMKTGSMKGIQCYAGYMLDDDYVPTHTVVVIMNEINGSRDKAKKACQKMLLDIFSGNVPDSVESGVTEAVQTDSMAVVFEEAEVIVEPETVEVELEP